MTHEELIENLGTIAHSGSKAFLNAPRKAANKNETPIGQFGVGFYSVFMVADSVKAYTRSWHKDGKCFCWSAMAQVPTIEEVEGERRGTRIVISLKEEYKDFAKKVRLEEIIKKYSAFVQFPVMVEGEKLNTVGAIWLKGRATLEEKNTRNSIP